VFCNLTPNFINDYGCQLNDVLNIFNSANRETNDKAPQSNQVRIYDDGECVWVPFFLWSVSHCAMDSTWFPFDEQVCRLVFESWAGYFDFATRGNVSINAYEDFEPNDLWELVGESNPCSKL